MGENIKELLNEEIAAEITVIGFMVYGRTRCFTVD